MPSDVGYRASRTSASLPPDRATEGPAVSISSAGSLALTAMYLPPVDSMPSAVGATSMSLPAALDRARSKAASASRLSALRFSIETFSSPSAPATSPRNADLREDASISVTCHRGHAIAQGIPSSPPPAPMSASSFTAHEPDHRERVGDQARVFLFQAARNKLCPAAMLPEEMRVGFQLPGLGAGVADAVEDQDVCQWINAVFVHPVLPFHATPSFSHMLYANKSRDVPLGSTTGSVSV
jgi:hypothetical protein